MGLCVFDVYEKYYNSKTGGMSNIMGKNPYPLSPQGVKTKKFMSKDYASISGAQDHIVMGFCQYQK